MSISEEKLKKIDELIAHREIVDTIYRLARGLDRCDKDLLSSCFHEGATDDHGLFKGTAVDFCDWVITELAKYERTQHSISNVNIVFDGLSAATESYFFAHHVVPGDGGKMDVIAAGRYLDRFENRSGVWRITHRKAVYDWSRVDDTKDGWSNPPISEILERGVQGRDDLSYDFIGTLGL